MIVIGIAAGLAMSGLILGAFSGSIWIMLGFFTAGVLVACVSEAVKSYNDKKSVSCKLGQYPPYGY